MELAQHEDGLAKRRRTENGNQEPEEENADGRNAGEQGEIRRMTDKEKCEKMQEELAVVFAARDTIRIKSIAENERMRAELAHRAAKGEESLRLYETTRKVVDNMKRYIIDREKQVASLKKIVEAKQEDLEVFKQDLDDTFGPDGLVNLVTVLRREVEAMKEQKAKLEKDCAALSSGHRHRSADACEAVPSQHGNGEAPMQCASLGEGADAANSKGDGIVDELVEGLPFASPEKCSYEEEVDRLIEDLCPGPAAVCV